MLACVALASGVAGDVLSQLRELDAAISAKERQMKVHKRASAVVHEPQLKSDTPMALDESGGEAEDKLRQLLIKMAKQREKKNGNVDARAPDMEAHLPHLFAHFDQDGDGEIDARELKHGLRSFGLSPHIAGQIMRRYDTGGEGTLRLRDFSRLAQLKKGSKKSAKKTRDCKPDDVDKGECVMVHHSLNVDASPPTANGPSTPTHLALEAQRAWMGPPRLWAPRAPWLPVAAVPALSPFSFLELSPRGGKGSKGGVLTAHDRAIQRMGGGFGGLLGGLGGGFGGGAGGRHGAGLHGGAAAREPSAPRAAPEFRRNRQLYKRSKYADSPRYAEVAESEAVARAEAALERRGVYSDMSAASAPLLPSLERMAAPHAPATGAASMGDVLPILPKDLERKATVQRQLARHGAPAPRAAEPQQGPLEPWQAVGLPQRQLWGADGGELRDSDLERRADPMASLGAAPAADPQEGVSVGPGGNVFTGLKLPPALVNGMNPTFTSMVHKPGSFHSRRVTGGRRRAMSVSAPGGFGYSGFGAF